MWCRTCQERDCGIDHGPAYIRKTNKKATKKVAVPEGYGRVKSYTPQPAAPVQLRLFK